MKKTELSEPLRLWLAKQGYSVSCEVKNCDIVAWLLNKNGHMSPSAIIKSGGGTKIQQILSVNIYGWFDKISRGLYTLNPAGKEVLKIYKEILKEIIVKIDCRKGK